jgi:PAS domain S-box-containing protein
VPGSTAETLRWDYADPRDGRQYHVFSAPLARDGGLPARITMVTDVSARRRAEQVLRESEQRYRRLLNSVNDYVYEVTVRDGVVVATRHGAGCEAVTGYTSSEYDRDPALWLAMVPPEDRAAVIEHARRIVEGLDVSPLEHRIRRKDGGVRWVRNTPVLRRDAQGRLVGYDGLIKDITDRRAAEEQRLQLELHVMESEREAHLAEVERLSVLGVLAAGVAHEVNNPLQGIVAHLGAVRADLPAGSDGLRRLEQVEHGIQAIASLVQRMLQLGSPRGDDGAWTTFNEAFLAVRDLLAPQLEQAGVRLSVNARASYARIAMPTQELTEILLNLLLNARDAMPEGGAITVQCDRRGGDVVVSVSDTGAGIAPDVLPRIFRPFFTTKGKKGTGLGLSTTESLIRSRRGDIRVESAPGRGATFTFRVPVQAAEPEAAP